MERRKRGRGAREVSGRRGLGQGPDVAARIALVVDAHLIHGKREDDAAALAAPRTDDPDGGCDHGARSDYAPGDDRVQSESRQFA